MNKRRGSFSEKNSCNEVSQLPFSIRSEFKLSYFYQKYTETYGIPVIGSRRVSSSALKRACYALRFYLANNDMMRETFYAKNVRLVVMATVENLKRIPEFKKFPNWWRSAKGISAIESLPIIAVSEDNVVCFNDEKE